MTEHEIRVRGRDFVAYRIGGAIAALLLGAALIWQAVLLMEGFNTVVPEVTWEATGGTGGGAGPDTVGAGEPTRALASEVLTQRTLLLAERYATGPAPNEPPPPLAVGSEERLTERPVDVGTTAIPQAWATPDEETIAIMRPRERVVGQTMVPYPNADIFERPEGRIWRRGMADYTTHAGAIAILGLSFLLAVLLAVRGRVPIAVGRDGRTVKRFGFFERAVHWMTAGSFVALALTGIVIAYGTTLILPVFGEPALGTIGWFSTWGHMMFAPPFFFGIALMAVMWALRNLPEPRIDIPWIARLGGFMSDSPDNPPAKKFNTGQKLTFWVAVLGGLAMTGTGITLMFPYVWLGISGMTWVMLAHAMIGLLMIAFFIGHAYIGTVGMQDAIHAMWSGRVDLNWAREHHELWVTDELARKGELPRGYDPHGHEPVRARAVPERRVPVGRRSEV
jgi:formate dehydrogenase subunit gamma